MQSRPKHLTCITAALLLLLTSPLQLPGTPLGKPIVLAQEPTTTTQVRKAEADRLYREGIKQFNSGQLQESLEKFQQVLVILREIGDRKGEGNTLNNIGVIYVKIGDFTKALEFYQQALAIHRAIGNLPDEGVTLNYIGEIYKYQGQDSKALEFFQQALDINSRVLGKEHPRNQEILINLGEVYNRQGQYSEALKYFQQALEISSRILGSSASDIEIIGLRLRNLGNVYTKLGDYSRAIESLQQSLTIARTRGNLQTEKQALEDLGNAYAALGDYSRAIDYLNQSMALARSFGDKQGELSVLGSIANSLVALDSHKALEFYNQALAIALQIANRPGEGQALNGLALAYQRLGEYSKALEFYQQALKIYREISDQVGEGDTLNNIGSVYASQGQYSKALEFYQEALMISQALENPFGKVATLNNIGLLHYELGEYEQALEFYQQTLNIRRNIGDHAGEATTLNNIGLVYDRLGQDSKALEFYKQALTIHQDTGNLAGEAITLNNIGLQYEELDKPSQSIKFLEQALSIFIKLGDRVNTGNTLDSIGTVYKKLDESSKALRFYRQALGILEELGNRPLTRITLINIGSLYEKQQQTELAIVFYKQSVNLTETIREDLQALSRKQQESYTETVAGTYRRLADLLLSQGRILEAQQVLELLKTQELRDFTRDTRAGGENPDIATNPTEAEILKIHGTLIALGRKIEECKQCEERSNLLDQREAIAKEFEQTVRSLEQEIRSRRETDKAFLDPSTLGGNAQEIVSAQPGTVLIYPLVLENKLWILWAAKGGITQSIEVPQVGLKQLSETVVKFRQLLQNPNSDIAEVKATSKQLYEWLIPESLQQELKKNKIQNLVFSLDRVTRYIPMSAVFDGEKYLVEEYNISTIISANLTQIGDHLPPGTQNTSVLALGLSEAKSGFNPLPNVPAELDAIVRQSPTDSQGIYPGLELLNQAFDRKALRDNLASHRILHIATHGEFIPGNAYASYLLLGDGDKLPIADIQSLRDLNKIHLVVLSACQTALGETGQDGSEIAGLSYYFLEKGAKAVMASLWQVNDESTRLLMEQFYSNFAKGTTQSPITKAQALRQAQLNLLQSDRATSANTNSRSLAPQPRLGTRTATSTTPGFSHPYYWAPFILIGNSL